MPKKTVMTIALFIILGLGVFFYHQYHYADPYDAILRQEPQSSTAILQGLKRWRYHTYVWFEFVPDALTFIFKRLGMGGWTETGQRVCLEGCPYWTQTWTDGVYSLDVEVSQMTFADLPPQSFDPPRYFDIEIWGAIRRQIQQKKRLPQTGEKVRICGPVRIDRPYYVYTIHPDNPDEVNVIGTCKTLGMDFQLAAELADRTSCAQFRSLPPAEQVALLDTVIRARGDRKTRSQLTEKMIACARPEVLAALATNADVYHETVKLSPALKNQLPALTAAPQETEGKPVANTIRDLRENWFGF